MRCERRAGVLGLPGVSRARCVPLDPCCWVALQPTQPNPTLTPRRALHPSFHVWTIPWVHSSGNTTGMDGQGSPKPPGL